MEKSNAMFSMMTVMASVAPEKDLVRILEDSVNAYKEGFVLRKSPKEMEELFQGLVVPCTMITIRAMKHDPIELIAEMEKTRNMMKMMDPGKQ